METYRERFLIHIEIPCWTGGTVHISVSSFGFVGFFFFCCLFLKKNVAFTAIHKWGIKWYRIHLGSVTLLVKVEKRPAVYYKLRKPNSICLYKHGTWTFSITLHDGKLLGNTSKETDPSASGTHPSSFICFFFCCNFFRVSALWRLDYICIYFFIPFLFFQLW